LRRGFSGSGRRPKCGYGSNKKTKYLLPSHFYPVHIANVKELEMLLLHNGKFAVVIKHGVSVRKRQLIIERAAQLDLKVVNSAARVKTEEHE